MVKENLNKIFLSASIPDPESDGDYYENADIIAIRDSVRALATVIVPNAHLVWGGHPSITPLIKYVIEKMEKDANDYMTLYQSRFFAENFPEENKFFNNIVLVDAGNDRKSSLLELRKKMLHENHFSAGVFIGGEGGIQEEYVLFKEYNPTAQILPIASTGAGAQKIYTERIKNKDFRNEELLKDYAYMSLFRKKLNDFL